MLAMHMTHLEVSPLLPLTHTFFEGLPSPNGLCDIVGKVNDVGVLIQGK
jgi:hypothetical protein